MSATEKMEKNPKVREEVTRGQLKFMLLLSFCVNLKNDGAEKVNPLQTLMNPWYSGALQERCRDTGKIFTS